MQDFIAQIRAANDSGLYYVGLYAALGIPDICGALEAADGVANGRRYADWFDRHVAPDYNNFLSGDTCYLFRCSMLHQGSTQHPRSPYSRILFVEPGTPGLVMHNNVMNDALNLDVSIFCSDMCAAADKWLRSKTADPIVLANLAKFVRRHPLGIHPYIVGVPVIG